MAVVIHLKDVAAGIAMAGFMGVLIYWMGAI